MATQKITIDPVTRIEGHLKIEVEIENGKVSPARRKGPEGCLICDQPFLRRLIQRTPISFVPVP